VVTIEGITWSYVVVYVVKMGLRVRVRSHARTGDKQPWKEMFKKFKLSGMFVGKVG